MDGPARRCTGGRAGTLYGVWTLLTMHLGTHSHRARGSSGAHRGATRRRVPDRVVATGRGLRYVEGDAGPRAVATASTTAAAAAAGAAAAATTIYTP